MIRNICYITYQTFPASTANSLQTISNIKYFIKNKCDLICGIPIGSIPLCSYISTTYNIPMIMVRPSVKKYGITDNIVGEYKSTNRCIIIDDVITSGGSIEEVVEVLKGKVEIVSASVIVDREQGYKCSIPVGSLYKKSDFELENR